MDPRLRAPFTMIVAGPTGSGKTVKIMQLIDNVDRLCTHPPEEIVYCYDEWQEEFEKRSETIKFHKGVIDVQTIPNDGKHRWVIIDDLMDELMSRPDANDLFTKRSHHRKISVLFVTQNVFHKNMRTISVNTHYFFIAKSPRDSTSVLNLAKQAFPGRSKFVMEAYADATRTPHSFLLMDMRQETDDRVRLLANYPPREGRPVIAYAMTGV